MNHDFTIFYYANLLKKHRKGLITAVAAFMLCGMLMSVFKPATYVSNATIFLPEASSPNATNATLGRIFGISDLAGSAKDIIMGVLQSRRMDQDVRARFQSNYKPFWWKIDIYVITGGLRVEIRGPDPSLTQKIGDFCMENLDKINNELSITPNKPMVKVLDPSNYGSRESNNMWRNIIIFGMFSFLVFSLYIFLADYIKKLKVTAKARA